MILWRILTTQLLAVKAQFHFEILEDLRQNTRVVCRKMYRLDVTSLIDFPISNAFLVWCINPTWLRILGCIKLKWKWSIRLLFFGHRSFGKITHKAVINIMKQCISNNLPYVATCETSSPIIWNALLQNVYHRLVCSPVPELSFLPAPYRGWTRAGEKKSPG